MDNSNPLFDDDDEEDFIFPEKSNAEEALPSLDEMMPDLGNFHLSSGMESSPIKSDTFEINDESASDAFSDESDLPEVNREVIEQDNGFDDDPLSEILDSLGDLDSLDSFDDDPIVDAPIEASPQERFESLLEYNGSEDDDDDYSEYEGRFIDLDKVISVAIDAGASDIHISPWDEIAFTVLGEIYRYSDFGDIDPNMTVRLQQNIISNVLEQMFVEDLELDTSYVVKTGRHKGRRLRLSVGKTEGNIFMVFRIIAAEMPTPDELDIPDKVQDWVKLPNGLVLVNGPTGSGKSTTLSSLIQEIQFTRREKVITIEKPIEFVYEVKPDQKAFITQREVGRDARSFASALTSAMRQAPNIILVGEVRNRLEIDELLRAAETGHLAISTMHTTSCPATINRIRSMYEGDEQLRVLATLADNLRGMMTQTLVKSPDGSKRFAVREVLQINSELKDYVLAGDVLAMRKYQEKLGITMEHELVKAVNSGQASLESARSKAPNPLYFDELLEAV